jgi:hypothetical protein
MINKKLEYGDKFYTLEFAISNSCVFNVIEEEYDREVFSPYDTWDEVYKNATFSTHREANDAGNKIHAYVRSMLGGENGTK